MYFRESLSELNSERNKGISEGISRVLYAQLLSNDLFSIYNDLTMYIHVSIFSKISSLGYITQHVILCYTCIAPNWARLQKNHSTPKRLYTRTATSAVSVLR